MKLQEKIKAIELRKQGISIVEIAKTLEVAKSSVSTWVRNIKLTEEQIEKLKINVGSHILKQAKISKDAAIQRHSAYEEAGYLRASIDTKFQNICSLYWGEGSKTTKKFEVANSDYKLIQVVFNWCCQNEYLEKIRFRVAYHSANTKSQQEIKQFWNNKLPQLQESNWLKFTIIDSIKYNCKKIDKIPYGTAYLMINSVELFFNIMGGIKYIHKSFNS